jgi:hypothetical protein
MKRIIKRARNDWARGLTEQEVSNWIEAMVEIGRTERVQQYCADDAYMVRCPFGKPLAIVR